MSPIARSQPPLQGGAEQEERIDAKTNVDVDSPDIKVRHREAELDMRTGMLDILPDGYGFLRTKGYTPSDGDVYVSLSQIRRFGLRRGDEVKGQIRRPKDNEKYFALIKLEKRQRARRREAPAPALLRESDAALPERTATPGDQPGRICPRASSISVAPIGKGQRGLIVSPPKAGKTTILKKHRQQHHAPTRRRCKLIVLLVDERPEEVTDMERSVNGEVISSTFDQPSENHIQVAELVLERAKRLVELKHDVVILLDSITRLARAHNLATPASGRILSGGVDSTALFPPKRFFGAARNIEEGGSLTIMATALVDTGSPHGRGHLRGVQGHRQHGASPRPQAGRQAHLPGHRDREVGHPQGRAADEAREEAQLVWKLRRVLHSLEPNAALQLLIDKLRQTKSNSEFLAEILRSVQGDD